MLHEVGRLNLFLQSENGVNRELTQRCQIKAKNDVEAVQCWLNEYVHKATTHRTYQKEVERFLLWSVYQQNKPLSSLNRDDLEAYLEFLEDPQPRSEWCAPRGGRGVKRGHPDWRPFVGPLGHAAKMTAFSAIDSLFQYLVDARYLSFNPFSLMRKKRRVVNNALEKQLAVQERILPIAAWHALLDTLEAYPESTSLEKQDKARLKFIIAVLYFLGLRVSELSSHCWNAFRQVDGRWWFYVMGKGDKLGRVPVNDELLRAVIVYRQHLNRLPYPAPTDTQPLVCALHANTAITPRYINALLKALALKTAEQFRHDTAIFSKLSHFSAHWLRHLSASMQDRAGIAFKHIRENHRHESDETTRLYVHSLDADRHEDMQKLVLRWPG